MTRAAFICLFALMTCAPAAEAHRMTLAGAERVANRTATRLAALVSPDEEIQWTVGPCRYASKTGHVVYCRATSTLNKSDRFCTYTIGVRFRSQKARTVKSYFPDEPSCVPID